MSIASDAKLVRCGQVSDHNMIVRSGNILLVDVPPFSTIRREVANVSHVGTFAL